MTNIENPLFHSFIQRMTVLVNASPSESDILAEGSKLLKDLIAKDDWLPNDYAKSDQTHYRQYLLYLDPQSRFSVVSFVWGPGQKTPIHNHTIWGLIGMLRGQELSQGFRLTGDGSLLPEGAPISLKPGEVDAVSPSIGDLHSVANALSDAVSISIHVYGADIGKVHRSTFSLDGTKKDFVSGYSNS